MQTFTERFIQWLPKGEKFTAEAINIITLAQEKATLCKASSVEAKHLLYGLLLDMNTTGLLLRNSGFNLEVLYQNTDLAIDLENVSTNKANLFSLESKYIFNLALQLAKLKQTKYITARHLLLGLIQFVQLGNNDLKIVFRDMDIESLKKELLA